MTSKAAARAALPASSGRALAVPARSPATASGAPVEAHTRVLRQLRVVFNAVKTHFQQAERLSGVGGAQVWALSVIRDRPGLGITDLAAALSVRQPTASNLVKSLVQQSLVDVRRDGPDRRSVQLHVRSEGRRLLRRMPGPFAGVLPDALAGLDADTLHRMEADLGLLIQRLQADGQADGIRLTVR